MKTYLYRASNLKYAITFWPQFHSGSQFLAPAQNRRFLRFIHTNNYHNHLLQTGFLSILKRSLHRLNFPEICAFINGLIMHTHRLGEVSKKYGNKGRAFN